MLRIICLTAILLMVAAGALAEDNYLNPPGPPGSEISRMRTLNEIQPATPIHSLPYSVTNSGKYVLVGDLSGTNGQDGIVIQADNVTVDLNGFTLKGGSGSKDAIDISGSPSSITILNGIIRGWGRYGVYASFADNMTVAGITCISNGWAENCSGISVGKNAEVRDCISSQNKMIGIYAKDSSVIRNCKAGNNGHRGIDAQNGSTVISCSTYENASDGIAAYHGSTVTRCTSYNNASRGFYLQNGCTISDSSAYANTNVGFYVGAGVTMTKCSASKNGSHGITGGIGCIITDCTSYDNTAHGIQVSQDGYVKDNSCMANGSAGIYTGGVRSRIQGNHVTRNDIGIDVNAADNIIVRNTAANNTTREYDIAGGNLMGTTQTSLTGAGPWDNFDLD